MTNKKDNDDTPKWKAKGYQSLGQYQKWNEPFSPMSPDDPIMQDLKAGKIKINTALDVDDKTKK